MIGCVAFAGWDSCTGVVPLRHAHARPHRGAKTRLLNSETLLFTYVHEVLRSFRRAMQNLKL